MKLSIVTGTRNRPDSLQRLIGSIERNTSVDWELIVADASDAPFPLQQKHESPIYFLPEHPRLGCSRGYNRAFVEARGDWVIWLNDDCEVLPGYDTNAIAYMESHPWIGLGALPYSNKGGPFLTNANSFDQMTYANFGIIRREFGNRIGWFDEIVKMYGCDNSIGFRALLSGLGIGVVPFSGILHHEHDDEQRHENLKGQQEDAARLKAKYEPLLPQMREVYERCRMMTL